ncbi:MAG: M16 family metallopeptidase [Sandaracinaceae bacterium]
MADHALASRSILERLNAGASKRARWSFVGERPFGSELSLQQWHLGNGLEVLILPDHSAPVLAYQTWFRVGSRHEEQGKTGLAHFFEHMMFNETKNLPWGEFDRRMEDAGGETNAATWIDWTYYHQVLPSEELPLAVELEADRMANLLVRKPQVESEREVVQNERRMAVEDDVRGAADERLYALAFGKKHPHGWPTIGWMADIEGYKVNDCRDFYKTWYAPNNATVVIVGDVQVEDTLAQIAAAYGGIRPSKLPSRRTPSRSRQRSERRATLRWPTPTEKIALGWHGLPYLSPDYPVLEVIDEILTGGRSARLRRRLVDELEIVSQFRGGVAGLTHGGLFDLWISMREGHAASEAVAVIDEEVARLQREPVSAKEIEKVKSRAELFTLSEIETAAGKAGQLGYARVVAGDPTHTFRRLEELRQVSAEDVLRVANEVLQPGRRSSVTVLPTGAES